jgi:vitamin B12 transporter
MSIFEKVVGTFQDAALRCLQPTKVVGTFKMQSPVHIVALSCTIVTLLPQSVCADEPAPIDVTVRGSTTSAFVSRVSVDDRTRENIDAASILAELPSVHVRRLGADGAQAALSIRGSASSQVGVLLNGIPLTSGADPTFDIGSLPLWPGATFRVYRGFAPASLGTTGYLGGIVAIDPPTSLTGARTDAQLLAGSFGTLKVRVGDTRNQGPVKLGIGLFGSRTNGDFDYTVTNPRTQELVSRTRTNSGAASAGAIARVAFERPWGTLGGTFFSDVRHVGLPGSATFPTAFSSLDTRRIVGGIDSTVRLRGQLSIRAQIWGRHENSRFADPFGEIDPTRTSNLAEQSILAIGSSLAFRGVRIGPVAISFLADGRTERLLPGDGTTVLGGVEASRIAGGIGLEIDARFRSAFRMSVSARLDGRHDTISGVIASKLPEDQDPTDFVPSGHVGASYRIAEAMTISSHLGFLRRFPSFAELYGDRGSLVGDPRLRIERAFSADLGAQGDVRVGRVALAYEVVAFVADHRDLITFLPLGRGTFRASNIGMALLAGAESSASLVAKNLQTTLSYTVLYTENRSNDPLAYGQSLPGRPLHDFSYDASYRIGPLRVRYGVDAVAGTTVDTAGTIVVPPRLFHGAGLSLDVPRMSGLTMAFEVQNLFDVRVMRVPSPLTNSLMALPVSDFLGFPLPGRSFWLSLRFRAP